MIWVLVIAIIIAIIAVATMPGPKPAKPNQGTAPTVDDGQQVLDVFGTVWIDDSFILAWKTMGTEPISAGGKK